MEKKKKERKTYNDAAFDPQILLLKQPYLNPCLLQKGENLHVSQANLKLLNQYHKICI